ncbi:MAG: hypothetical protein RJB32_339, partial [Actinomycetota bacterium]
MAGDAVRYSVGWSGWGLLVVIGVVASVIGLALTKPWKTILRVPLPLALLLGLMVLSAIWSNYRNFTWLGVGLQLGTTLFALFLANQFGWRQLLNIFANTIRFILVSSLLFEVVAGFTGPIKPFFPNYEGDEPPASSYYWSQGQLFDGDRIQGITGNANLLAFTAVLGILLFLVEYLVTNSTRSLPLASLALAILMAALAKSAGMTLAIGLVSFAALIAIFAEGRPKATRHLIYGRSLWALALGVVLALIYRVELFDLLGRSADASGRFFIWGEVLELIFEKPLEGWGWISYWIPGVEPYEGLIVINSVPMYQAHNAFLDVWLQLGVFGLMLMVWLLLQGFIRLWAVAVRHTNPLYLYPLFAYLVIVAQSLTESRLLIEIGWVLLVLLTTKSREPFAELEPLGRTPKRLKLLRIPGSWLRSR